MNLPNKLTVLRLFMVPLIVIVMLLPMNPVLSNVLAAAVFGLTALTDMLDGKIARKYNLITDFGKFLDPLADKFMVISTLVVLLFKFDGVLRFCCLISTLIVIMRELAVTSIRLVVSSSAGIVVAANMLGKIKTVSQIVYILCAFLEPVLFFLINKLFSLSIPDYHVLTYASMLVMTVFTIWSGINYLGSYWKYLDTNK
ncbi:MAG: CDP-diacylglycerol--glycerol-3-phosphate 3-phosphatidyltransferase [Ruminococcaceae bacterium]|nr:CDP-diacylglycerol--glycerol-3-phosphate 3-phosphatidyltransferase [Oscillospiraceae bacterium]